MKIKSILMVVATILVAGTVFSSCSKDNAIDKSKLVGTWHCQKATGSFMGQTVDMTMAQIRSTMQQAAGGQVNIWDETLVITETTINGITYTLSGSQIVSMGGQDISALGLSFYSVTDTQLTLRYSISEEGMTMVIDVIYDKVK